MQKQEVFEWIKVLEHLRSSVLGLPEKNTHEIMEYVDYILNSFSMSADDYISKDEFVKFMKKDLIQLDFFKIIGILTSEDLLSLKQFTAFENDYDLTLRINKQVTFEFRNTFKVTIFTIK